MKLQQVSYARPIDNNKLDKNKFKNNPSFGNLAVGLATFIENNGFLGEFLTIDTVGMMTPRTIQGYLRNKEELGHLNYKAGREEMVRELLSGPAYFYVPLSIMTIAGILRGKTAKVQTKVLESFKSIMKNTKVNLKDAAVTKENFVETLAGEAFKGYEKEKGLIDNIKNLMKQSLQKDAQKGKIRNEADALMTKLNKANGKFLDSASSVKIGDKQYDMSNLIKDMSNYLDDFTQKASKTTLETESFVEKFHKKAKDLRNATNILAVAALSAFLTVIPKIYQTGKSFPGKDGLAAGTENAQAPAEEAKEAV